MWKAAQQSRQRGQHAAREGNCKGSGMVGNWSKASIEEASSRGGDVRTAGFLRMEFGAHPKGSMKEQ